MRSMRTGLLFAVTLTLAFASPLTAQVAPTLTGETGLFELTNAEVLPIGRFSFGLYFSQSDRTAAPSLLYATGADDPLRYGTGKIGITAGFGLTGNWELTLSAGQRYFRSDPRDWSGVINGHERFGEIRHDETDKVRIGTKLLLNPRTEPVKLVLFGGVSIPTQSKNDNDALSTPRADWDFGASLNYGALTFQAAYLLAGDQDVQAVGANDVPNQFKWGLGFAIPIVPKTLRAIAEINRIHYDGGATKPGDFSEVLAGLRIGIPKTGLVAGAAVRANIDRWVKYGSRPSNIGGVVQLSYVPPVADAAIQRVTSTSTASEEPAPAPVTPPAAAPPTSTPAPSPVTEPPPAARPETSTTDEILFDTAKSRLTNIAKAILDGVALRLKNNLSATCTVVGHTDPKEKGGDHMALCKARSEAAKDYLVKRHGIDASRIKTDAKGDVDSGPDGVRNRRAVVTVTFP